MKKSQKITLIVSIIIGLALVSGSLVIAAQKRRNANAVASIKQHPVTHAELAAADGKNGHTCYVAIDNTVYQIKDFSLWQNGKHTPSNGLAYCGADLSKVIDQAPHGRSILKILPIVGPLIG